MKPQSSLPNQAEIIVIGGGVIGVSVAYHLALAGKRDVLLLEKAELTHGCTWHAAGLVGQLRGKLGLTRLMQYSTELFSRLETKQDFLQDGTRWVVLESPLPRKDGLKFNTPL